MKDRFTHQRRQLKPADRTTFLVVGIGIVVINVLLIALLFSP